MQPFLILFTCLSIAHTGFTSTKTNVCKKEISTQKGRNFLVTFSTLDSSRSFDGIIYIGSELSGSLNVTYNYGNSSTKETIKVLAGINQLNISTNNLVQDTAGIQKTKGIQIKSTLDISVYMTAYSEGVAAAYTVFPETTWSTRYVVSVFKPASRYNVVMISNLHEHAQLQVIKKNLFNLTRKVSIHSDESYVLMDSRDMSGTIVQSDKPVSLVCENKCASIPTSFSGCDTLIDSVLPVDYWETEFIIPPLLPKLGYLIRVFAHMDNETVHIILKNRTNTVNQTFTGMYETLLGTDALIIITDKKVNVVQYGVSQTYDNIDGDAFMASVPALRHYGKDYFIPTPFASDGFINTMVVTIRDVHLPGLLLNGKSMDLKAMKTVIPVAPYDDFRIIFMNLTSGNYNLSHQAADAKYSVLLYGRKDDNGFGFYLGYTFKTDEKNNCSHSDCTNDGQNAALCKTDPPRCFSCDYTSGLSYCDEIMACSNNQTCYVQSFTNLNGHTHYRSGCIDYQTCRLNEHGSNSKGTCLQCCEGDFCNSHGCGDNGFPPKQSRGPLCLDCSHVSDPKECDKITICSSNEVCRIEEFPWGDDSIFHLGCASVNDCAIEQRSLNPFNQRSVPVCTECCQEDYCNTNCTGRTHNQQQIIVG